MFCHRKQLLLSIALMVLLFTVCGVLAQAEKKQLSVSLWINIAENIEPTKHILREYEETHPDIELELFHQPWNGYHEKIQTLIASGIGPDVMVLSRVYLPAFAEAGVVQPIDGFLEAETRFDVETDVAEMVSGRYMGKTYGFPIWGGPAVMAFNADMFAESGLLTPDRYVEQDKWNWDTYVEIGKKVTRDKDWDGTPDIFMCSELTTWMPVWNARIWQNGGRIINDQYSKALIDRKPAVEALEYWLGLAHEHHIAPKPGDQVKAFGEQGLAMVHTWSTTAVTYLAKPIGNAFKIGLVMQPAGPEGYFHLSGGCPVTVSSTTKYPKEAYDFAAWFALFSNEWQLVGLPASMDVLRSEYLDYLGEYFLNPQAIVNALMHPTRMEAGIGVHFAELQEGWNPILQQAINEEISAKEAAVKMANFINSILGSD